MIPFLLLSVLWELDECHSDAASKVFIPTKNISGDFQNESTFFYCEVQINIMHSSFVDFVSSTKSSGAMSISGKRSILNCTSTTFENCRSFSDYGGAIGFKGQCFMMSCSNAIKCSSTKGGQFFSSQILDSSSIPTCVDCSSISQCSDDVENGLGDSMYIRKGINRIFGLNVSRNRVMYYGSAFSFQYGLVLSTLFSNFLNNTGKNMVFIRGVKNQPFLQYCNVLYNEVATASMFCFDGHYRVSNSVFFENIGPLAARNWKKDGTIIITACVFDINYRNTEGVQISNCNVNNAPTFITFKWIRLSPQPLHCSN